jgi:hypothetical protein
LVRLAGARCGLAAARRLPLRLGGHSSRHSSSPSSFIISAWVSIGLPSFS